jgi:phospholipid transport system substrate-binding protein
MRTHLKKLAALLVLAGALALPTSAFAGDAQNLVQAKHSEVVTQLKKPATPDRDKTVAAVLAALFDYDSMAQRSMGKNWETLTEEQRTEFTATLKQLIQKNLEKSIKNTINYDLEFLGEEGAPEGVMVKTKASNKQKPHEEPIEIAYNLHQKDGAWKAFDVVTEGASMVNNYKSQFNRILGKEGYAGLIKKMKSKLAA